MELVPQNVTSLSQNNKKKETVYLLRGTKYL